MTFSISPAAEDEFFAAAAFYERAREGLGEEFARAVARTLVRIMEFPESGREIQPAVRQKLVKRFPYLVVYDLTADAIRVIAIRHSHRSPDKTNR
jgi:plasmid stabilization system protein ParE